MAAVRGRGLGFLLTWGTPLQVDAFPPSTQVTKAIAFMIVAATLGTGFTIEADTKGDSMIFELASSGALGTGFTIEADTKGDSMIFELASSGAPLTFQVV